jgi:rhodanese-related sulfurtransferase
MFKTKIKNGVPEISPEDAKPILNSVILVDVRNQEEYYGELSHIKGSKLVTLGPDLTNYLENSDKQKEILFVCKSGGRSGKAALEALKLGHKSVASLSGGMILWNELKYPVEK